MTRLLRLFLLMALFGAPLLTFAAGGLVPCDGPECNLCSMVSLFHNVLNFLISAAFIIATIMFVYAGFEMLRHADNTSAIAKAKNMFSDVMVGFIFILASWLIIDSVMRVLFTTEQFAGYSGPWSEILCAFQTNTPEGTASTPPQTTSGVGGGSCQVLSDGACGSAALGSFGDAATQASQICNRESGGHPDSMSRTDVLTGTNIPFSGGLFQVNLTQHDLTAPACRALNGGVALNCSARDISELDSAGAAAFTGSNYQAHVSNHDMYTKCVAAVKDPACNIQTAHQIFIRSNYTWQPWVNSARACSLI